VPGVAEELKRQIEMRFPGLKIVGTYTPPFRQLNDLESRDLQRRVREARPDFFWVGLSAPKQERFMAQHMSILQKMGIGIEGFGPNTFKIDSLPAFLQTSDPISFMQRVIDDLKSASNSSSALRLGEEMIAMTVCRHAVKANDPLRYLEVEKLIQDLLECDLPYCCPHGRPTMIQISLSELEKKFGRKA
jgi:DNA mismatch repair protein MutL